MSYENLEAAVNQAAKRFLELSSGSGGLGLSSSVIAWPGVTFTPPSNAAWVSVEKLPISSMPVTMGIGGEDDEKGILQLSLYFPSHLGEGALRAAVGKAKRYFTAGSTSTYSGAVARFQHAKNSPYFRDDARFCCHVSIYWHGRTTRPSPIHNT
jgi:hypothetical protein